MIKHWGFWYHGSILYTKKKWIHCFEFTIIFCILSNLKTFHVGILEKLPVAKIITALPIFWMMAYTTQRILPVAQYNSDGMVFQ